MATFDQLSAEQRAIIELVLKQGQSYGELGETLGLSEARVEELARKALTRLSPVSAAQVDEEWRGPIADYLLGQQSGTDSTATRAHLRRSEAARAWSRSLLDSLEQFYDPAAIPTIPSGDGGAARPRKEKAPPAPAPREDGAEDDEAAPDEGKAPARAGHSPEARAIIRRRRIAAAAAFAVMALLAILLWPIGLLAGGDDGGEDADARQDTRPAPRVIGQLVLKPIEGAQGAGVAAIAERGRERTLVIQARLTPNKEREAYEVWLYNSDRDARSLGGQVTDRQGTYQGARELPKDFARFRFIDVSRERVDDNKGHSGQSVLRGRIADFAAPPPAQGTQTTPQP